MNHKISFPIQNISSEEVEELLFIAEQAGRKYIQKQIPSKEIKKLDILIEFDNTGELKLECVVDLELVKHSKFDPQKMSDEAAQKIFEIMEEKLKVEPEERV
jgi:hypothetical protein